MPSLEGVDDDVPPKVYGVGGAPPTLSKYVAAKPIAKFFVYKLKK
jgi:hypothetical protein